MARAFAPVPVLVVGALVLTGAASPLVVPSITHHVPPEYGTSRSPRPSPLYSIGIAPLKLTLETPVLTGARYVPPLPANMTIQVPVPDVSVDEYTISSRPSPFTSSGKAVLTGTTAEVDTSPVRPDTAFWYVKLVGARQSSGLPAHSTTDARRRWPADDSAGSYDNS